MSPEKQLEILKLIIVDFVASALLRDQEHAAKAFGTLKDVAFAVIADVRQEVAKDAAQELITKAMEKQS